MSRKIINFVVLFPVAIILVLLSVANRQVVTLALNPFRPEDKMLAFTAPFFVFLFLALIPGMLLGSAATCGFRKGNIASALASKQGKPSAGMMRRPGKRRLLRHRPGNFRQSDILDTYLASMSGVNGMIFVEP